MPVPLMIGVVLAVGCLAYVLYPLVRPTRALPAEPPSTRAAASTGRTARRVSDDEIEAVVRQYRAGHFAAGVCRNCGPRPESDAIYCSACGRPLNPAEGSAPG